MQTTETGTDDQHVGVFAARQGRPQRDAAREGAGVVGADMLGGLLEHGSLVNFQIDNFMKIYTTEFTKPSLVLQINNTRVGNPPKNGDFSQARE
ncbi:hypothetical protein D9M68_983020 [compost metagenome]